MFLSFFGAPLFLKTCFTKRRKIWYNTPAQDAQGERMAEEKPAVETQETENTAESAVTQTAAQVESAENHSEKGTPYRTFASKEEFDHHAAGMMSSARAKVEREILSALGLRPDERDKLPKLREAYDASLTEAERSAARADEMRGEVERLRAEIAEKDATIAALSKIGGKTADDVSKYVRMARGLAVDGVSIDDAIGQVMAMVSPPKPAPIQSQPLAPQPGVAAQKNPFMKGQDYNLTEQGRLKREDVKKARSLYLAANGSLPAW